VKGLQRDNSSSLPRSGGEGNRSAQLIGGGADHVSAHRDQALSDGVYVREYIPRRDADHFKSQGMHVRTSAVIVLCLISEVMHEPVDLNHQLCSRAVKVSDKWTNRVLAAETHPRRRSAQPVPESNFGRTH
jgi:hypothetical protein